MLPADVTKWLVSTRSEVDRACQLLTSPSPESLDCCLLVLERAGRSLADLGRRSDEGRGNSNALEEEAHRLRRSVLRAGRLLESAADFHLSWSRLRGVIMAGYTERGDPAPVPRQSRISLQG